VKWADPERLLLDLQENVGLRVTNRAYVDPELFRMTCEIRDRIAAYTSEYQLVERFGPFFDTSEWMDA
jgi:hypothetical protein